MWTPLDVPIEVSRNGITGIGLEIWDEVANQPLDLTGISFYCRVGKALGEPSVAQFGVNVADALMGAIDITFDGSKLQVQGVKEIVRLAYEIKSSEGDTVVRGPLYLIPGI